VSARRRPPRIPEWRRMTTDRPLRVLLWSPRGAGEHYYGPGSFAYRLYSLADPARVRVSLAHGNPDQQHYDLFDDQISIARSNGHADFVPFLLRSKRWIRAHGNEFDVMHALAGFHASVAPAYYAQRQGLPSALFVAGHRGEFTDKPGLKSLARLPARRRRMIKELSAVIAMSGAIYRELRALGVSGDRIARIPMGVNTERFRPASGSHEKRELRAKLGLPQDVPVVLFVGAVTPRKRPLLLVESLARLRRSGRDCHLVIVGPDKGSEYVAQISDAVGSLGLESAITRRPHSQAIEQYFRAADIFALPSQTEREGMPAAMVEAMATGLAVVGTRTSGIEDLIEDGINGRLVDPTIDSMSAVLDDYLKDPEALTTHGKNSREAALRRYDAVAVLGAYEALFRGMLAGLPAAQSSTLPDME